MNDYSSNPHESLKELEQENGQLLELIKYLEIQNDKKNMAPFVKLQQIDALETELEILKEKYTSQLKRLQEENDTYLQQIEVLDKAIKKIQVQGKVFGAKNEILENQIKEYLQKRSVEEELKSRVMELEKKLAQSEENLARCAQNEIKKLHSEMGFPLTLAKEAIVANKTFEDAVQWLMEKSRAM